jgi:chromosome segregation ATPase
MPSAHPPEHARHLVERLLRNVPISVSAYRQLITLANSMEGGKSELRGHLSARTAQLDKATRELKHLQRLQSDDALIGLYSSGATLLSKQADDIKNLKLELQRAKEEYDRLVPKLVEKDKQISQVEDEKKNCREAMRRLEVRLNALEAGPRDVQAGSNQELVVLKQRLDDYRKMADDQQEHINNLTQENDRLVMPLGRQHFNELDLP